MKVRTRGVALVSAALVATLGVAACSSSGNGGGGGNGSGTGTGSAPAPADQLERRHQRPRRSRTSTRKPVSALKQGGTLIWGIDQYSTQWNYNEVDGPESSTSNVMNALMPQPFVSDAKANVTPDPDYVTSAAVTSSASPQTIEIKLNPKAMWSDGTPITEADYAAQWKALNGKTKAYQVASTTGYDQISSVTQGSGGKFDVVVKFAKPFADWKSLFSPLYPAAYNIDPNKFNKGYLNAIPVTAGPFGNAAVRQVGRRRSQ